MDKFENILNRFIKNPYEEIKLSNSFLTNFKRKFIVIFYTLPTMLVIFSLFGYFAIYNGIDDNYDELNQFDFLMYFYKYLGIIIPIFYVVLIKNYFHIKYKVLSFRTSMFYFAVGFFILLILFPFSGLFIIDGIQSSTIYLYYITAIIFFIIYYFYYKKKWIEHIFINNYEKYKKEVFKKNFPEDLLVGKFNVNLKENEKEKPLFTKTWEFIAMIMLRFGFTLPVVAAMSGSGMANNDAMIYFCIYMFLFMIPYVSKMISSGVIFNQFLKQIEKEENVTIYNGIKLEQ